MFRFITLSVVFCLAAGHKTRIPILDGRVIGGETVEIEQYPYQVSLQQNGGHVCGATLISDRFVLTAGHCTEGTYARDLSIRAGSSYHANGGVVVQVLEYHEHEEYDPDNLFNDISVIELMEPVQFSASIQPAALASRDPDFNAEVIVSGWGRTSNGNPAQLQATTLNVVNKDYCIQAYKDINDIIDNQFCAAAPLRDACQGDSGGPLVGDGVLVGVVSWGYGCAHPEYPGVYISVTQMRDFIRKYANV